MVNYSELNGKNVVVTGANSGIGYAQVQAFLAQGCQVFGLDYSTDQMELIENNKFSYFQLDLNDLSKLEPIVNELPQIDILCNTAGILDDYRSIEETSIEQWDFVIGNNLTSMFTMTKLLLSKLNRPGNIINMASIAGMVAGGGGIAYTASKHAIIGLTKQLAIDLADKNIRVNALAPGCIKTPMNKKDFANGGKIAKEVAQQVPIKRWATADEVANVSLFLSSDSASYLQGDVIPVDGGWVAK